MRWLLPYVLAFALAAGEPVGAALGERRRRGAARHRHTDLASVNPGPSSVVDEGPVFISQGGAFDPATGTLTWFDDDLRYN